MLYTVLGSLFVVAYYLIATEHKSHINKSGISLVLGSSLWVILAMLTEDRGEISKALVENGGEIFEIVIFLLSAMTIVEILVHNKFFDWIQYKIIEKEISSTNLFWLLGLLSFVMSAFLDNLTTTLIMIQIGRKIYKHQENFLLYVANTIIAANAGGAASPIGDVTTIMLLIAGKFNAAEVIMIGTIPAVISWLIPQYLLARKVKVHEEAEKGHPEVHSVLEKIEPYWPVVYIGMFSFGLPVIFNMIGLPPFLGLLLGVGILWVFIDIKAKNGHPLHSTGKVIDVIQKTDIATLKFFIGILLAVGALAHAGLLATLNNIIFGENINAFRLVVGNTILGVSSSILDNVPLVAAAIKMFPSSVPTSIWVLLALTAGTGGSILVIGSAAGVAAMGQVKELSFAYYAKKASLPAFLGYVGAVLTWILLYLYFPAF